MYRTIEDLPPTTRAGLFVERVAAMDTGAIMPIVLELFVSSGTKTAERDAALMDVESFLVRRMVCRLTPKNYNRLAIDLLKALSDGTGTPRERLRGVLLASDADTLRWPTDEEFVATLLNDRLYRTLTRKRLRMFLRALEQQLHTGKTEQLDLEKRLTIEHLMPRQWKKHWPLAEDTSAEAEERRDHIVHTLGNLTLLTRKLNPSVSNGPWEKKLSQISRHSLLRLNKEIETHNRGMWDEAAIHARGKAMAALACKTWPRPT